MEYRVVQSGYEKMVMIALGKVERLVKQLIEQGWEPQGGISVLASGSNYIAAQAMIRKGVDL